MDYKWTPESRDAWFESPHWQRLDLLSARGNALHAANPTMPLTLCFEYDDYSNIQFYEGVATATLYYNTYGTMYIGFFADMSQHASRGRSNRNHRLTYTARKVDIGAFQVRTGLQAVQQLQAMYRERRQEALFLYGTIVRKSIEAHRAWVANGGYTIETDPSLGEKVSIALARARGQANAGAQTIEGAEIGRRLRELRRQADEWWPARLKQALEDYCVAATDGVVAVSRFMVRDINWATLTADEKDKVIDVWDLEQEARTHNITLSNLNTPEPDSPDSPVTPDAPVTPEPPAAPAAMIRGRGRGQGRGQASTPAGQYLTVPGQGPPNAPAGQRGRGRGGNSPFNLPWRGGPPAGRGSNRNFTSRGAGSGGGNSGAGNRFATSGGSGRGGDDGGRGGQRNFTARAGSRGNTAGADVGGNRAASYAPRGGASGSW